jgi:hypothetical protein
MLAICKYKFKYMLIIFETFWELHFFQYPPPPLTTLPHRRFIDPNKKSPDPVKPLTNPKLVPFIMFAFRGV